MVAEATTPLQSLQIKKILRKFSRLIIEGASSRKRMGVVKGSGGR
jgi:hypothetical protein